MGEVITYSSFQNEETDIILGGIEKTLEQDSSIGLNIPGLRPYGKRHKKILEMHRLSKSGVSYAEDIFKKVGLAPITGLKYACKAGIDLPPFRDPKNKYKNIKRIPARDRLIRKGLDIEEIGKKCSVGGKAIRQYIMGTGQDSIWKEGKKTRKEEILNKEKTRKKEIGGIVLSVLEFNSTDREAMAYNHTQFYFSSKTRKSNELTFDRVYDLIMDYFLAKKNNKTPSLECFGFRHKMHPGVVGKVLSEIGLETLACPNNNRKKRKITPKYKKESLARSVPVEMTSSDIAFFLSIPVHTVSMYFSRYYKGDDKRPFVSNAVKSFDFKKTRREILTYRIASEIYQSRSLGFNDGETKEILNLDQRVFDYAMEHVEEISEHIIGSLEQMFLDKDVKNPWVDFEIS